MPEERSVRRVGGRPASQDDVSEPTPRTAVATVAVVDPSDRRGWEPAHSKQSGLSCKPSASGLGVAINSTEATALKTAALHGAGGEVIIFSFFILTKVRPRPRPRPRLLPTYPIAKPPSHARFPAGSLLGRRTFHLGEAMHLAPVSILKLDSSVYHTHKHTHLLTHHRLSLSCRLGTKAGCRSTCRVPMW